MVADTVGVLEQILCGLTRNTLTLVCASYESVILRRDHMY